MNAVWDNITTFLGKVAPSVANALLPGSGLAFSMLSNALTGKENATQEEISAAMQMPDATIKLKELENDFLIKMAEINAQSESLKITAPLADTANARQRETQLAQSGHTDNTARILAFVDTGLIAVVLIGLFFVHIDEAVKDIFLLVLGGLVANLNQERGYYFGSSIGSRNKDKVLENVTRGT